MVFSPISELPSVGRNLPYITTFSFFMLFTLFTALAKTWPQLLAARFFQGFMGSPALATGGASMQDMVSRNPFQIANGIDVSPV